MVTSGRVWACAALKATARAKNVRIDFIASLASVCNSMTSKSFVWCERGTPGARSFPVSKCPFFATSGM